MNSATQQHMKAAVVSGDMMNLKDQPFTSYILSHSSIVCMLRQIQPSSREYCLRLLMACQKHDVTMEEKEMKGKSPYVSNRAQ